VGVKYVERRWIVSEGREGRYRVEEGLIAFAFVEK
jgi:hypothetical protein